MGSKAPVITLLTDFGLRDAYVGVMKGVIHSVWKKARIVDLTHGIEPGDVAAAGHLLASSFEYFPEGTVHVAVVDPGVGSDRRVLAARAGSHLFLAPDNGMLTDVFAAAAPSEVVSVEDRGLFLEPVSRTFHGRDIFAPVAAAVARGAPLGQLGPAVSDPVRLPRREPVRESSGDLTGEVVYLDRFGNLVTNLRGEQVEAGAVVEVAGRAIRGVSESYSAVGEGELLAIVGSGGRLEISINRGDAAGALGANVGEPVRVRMNHWD